MCLDGFNTCTRRCILCIADPTRIAAQIVTGIGFFASFNGDGLTARGLTAATIWASASIGLAIAFGYMKLQRLQRY